MAEYHSDFSLLRGSPLGDDPALIEELHSALADSVGRQVDLLARARCDGNWHIAAARLAGLAASFGVDQLAALASEAESAAPGDPVIIAKLRAYLAELRAALAQT
ncbi:Hpt domain-containing protein [Alterisphingorhabdus coralli]|uniref:Hpt domain-containing protein n=1 Tax=Alterisphingorhabdus coralli TaxID=3071408 RepID=A0AA97HZK6_9SPHN|nr:Hpt domain-containing protein [Parasphingorhabdus sp. SCSIO 66989]WOE73937.1 Hpt domain-containing protein [Parasphingorhabdus sp. SCSIO 66989]